MLEHFHLAVNPFGIAPKLDFLYRSAAFEESMAHLVYGLDNNEAIVMITGKIGMGKTMAIQSFLSHLGDRYISALVTNTNVDGKELLKLILDDLGQPITAGADKSDLIIALKNFLIKSDQDDRRIIIIIDEAQNLGREVLEEVRLLTNIGQGARQPVQIVLVGQPELDATVQRADLAQLRQRIRVHYKLEPLTRSELEEYVDHRMSVAGGSSGIFAAKALGRIHSMSGGVPRVVNTLCEDALLTAYLAGHDIVEEMDVEQRSETVIDSDKGVEIAGSRDLNEAVPAKQEPGPQYAVRQNPPLETGPNTRLEKNTAQRKPAFGIAVLMVLVIALGLVFRVQIGTLWGQLMGGSSAVVITEQKNEELVPQIAVVAIEDPADVAPVTVAADVDSLPSLQNTITQADAIHDTAGEINETVGIANPVVSVPVDFFIHISSFRDSGRADNLANQMSASGIPAMVVFHTVQGTGWYRINVGPFGNRDLAVQRAEELLAEGKIKYYKVVRPSAENE